MKEDLRARRTKHMIREAFLELLESYSLDEITIKQITDKAFCNRNTFYLHYQDKYDLIDQMCEQAIEQLLKRLDRAMQLKGISMNDFYLLIPEICLDCMEENLKFYVQILGQNKYPKFSEQYRQAIISYIFRGLNSDPKTIKTKIIEIEYSTSGMIGVNKYWLNHLDSYSRQDILKISHNLIIGMGKVIYENE